RHLHETDVPFPECLQQLNQAVLLYRGEFLAGLFIDDSPPLEEWILLRRARLEHQVLDALQQLAVWHEALGEYEQAYHFARREIELDPLREEAYRRGMRALALGGKASEAVALYQSCWRLLDSELGAPPSAETEMLLQQIRTGKLKRMASPAIAVAVHPQHNLPLFATPLIGRESELAQLTNWLLDPAVTLISVVGPGGVGKTRLAAAAAANVAGAFADGVWFAALAPVENEGELITALAQLLGLVLNTGDTRRQLFDFLQRRAILLVLDNFEQLTAAADLLAEMLAAARHLRLLVTTRARLNLRVEQILPLDGLPTAANDLSTNRSHTLSELSSVRLFVEQAQRTLPTFALQPDNAAAVLRLCQLVDGLPLGIELAANWVDQFSCAEIAEAIAQGGDFLTSPWRDQPARHRSMRAVFEYSWRLLPAAEQRVLAHSALFVGPFSRSALAAVSGAGPDHVRALVHQSLLRPVASGYFVLHELLRQFAQSKVDEYCSAADEQAGPMRTAIHQRYCQHYLQLLAATTPALFGATPHQALASLQVELENLRLAWRLAAEHRWFTLIEKALPALARFYDLAGLHRAALTTFQQTLEALTQAALGDRTDVFVSGAVPPTPAATPPAVLCAALGVECARARNTLGEYQRAVEDAQQAATGAANRTLEAAARHQLGIAYYRLGNRAAAEPALEQALNLARSDAARWLEAECLLSLGDLHTFSGATSGRTYYETALQHYRALGDRRGEGAALNCLGVLANLQRLYDQARSHFEEALAIHRTIGDRRNEGIDLNNLANVHAVQANYAESDLYLTQSLRLARATGYRAGEVNTLINLGINQADQDHHQAAQAYYEEALPIARAIGYGRALSAVLNNLAWLVATGGEYVRALALYTEAAHYSARGGELNLHCGHLQRMAALKAILGDYASALDLLREAARVALDLGDQRQAGRVHSDLGMILYALADETAAEQQVRKALAWARADGDSWGEAKALADWLVVRSSQGSWSDADAAFAVAEKAAHRDGSTLLLAYVARQKGVVALAHGALDEAASSFTHSLTLYRQQGGPADRLAPLAGLATVRQRQGRSEEADLQLEELLALLRDQPAGAVDNPVELYRLGWQFLAANDPDRAALWLKRAHSHLGDQAARLENGPLRERFLARVARLLPGGVWIAAGLEMAGVMDGPRM
ncbi:MAG TPA: tetratricopeptide repeat protein, partial [Caldilineaceae bacterium]|nr:tetratricopeptide repeat protein [Caldilineaceae bacterium]